MTLKGQDFSLTRNLWMNRDMNEAIDYWHITHPQKKFHSSLRPFLSASIANAQDSLVPFKFYGFRSAVLSHRLGHQPHKKKWTTIQYHPIVDVEYGMDQYTGKAINAASAGLQVRADVNENFSACLTARGGRLWLPYFLDTVVKYQKVLPGIGQAYGNSRAGYAWSDFTGYLSWSPKRSKIFNIQGGRDRQFVGDGYRSILLSDFAPPSWYYKMSARFWRMQYSVWYNWFYDVQTASGVKKNYTNKFGTFHHLSYNITDAINLSLFENVIWRGSDTGQARSFDVNYLSPVVFFRPIEYASGSPDNSFLGLNLSFIVAKRLKVYGQLGLDEFYLKEIRARSGWWANKQAWQLGAKYLNAFGIKGLKLQVEHNHVRPFTYTHGLVDQNYGHNGLALAHPLGANFKETLGMVTYRRGKLEIGWQVMAVLMGRDSVNGHSNMGQNLFKSYTTRSKEYGNYTGQGLTTNILQNNVRLVWHVLPALGARLEAGYILRAEQAVGGYKLQSPYLYVGFRTSIFTESRDF